jgi:hypothetical protein
MNRLADLPIPHQPPALASIPVQSPVPGPWPEPEPSLPPGQAPSPDGVPLPLEPLDIPPQIPPEIREPHQPGEHLPLNTDPVLSPPTRH